MQKQKKIKQYLLLLFGLISSFSYAQDGITSTGGNATGTQGNISYSVGQLGFTTYTGTSGSLAQGVQQPFEISVITGINEILSEITCSFYPNPTSSSIILKVEELEKYTLQYQLFDISGKELLKNNISDKETIIEMGNLFPATYILQVRNSENKIKSFKIIRN